MIAEDAPEIVSAVRDVYPQINETLEAVVLDGSLNQLLKVGHRTAELKKPADIRVRTFGDIGINN